jgi:hypothetical protein
MVKLETPRGRANSPHESLANQGYMSKISVLGLGAMKARMAAHLIVLRVFSRR